MHSKKRKVYHMCLLCILLMTIMCSCKKEKEEQVPLREAQTEQEKAAKKEQAEEVASGQDPEGAADVKDTKEKEIYVHVCGQVQTPGVYKLPKDSRVFEAIEAAGGVLEDADGSMLNQAEGISDGQQIYVPKKGEVMPQENEAQQGEASDGKVNINTAPKEELMTINGIGEARAESILKYRQEHGAFQSTEELKEVEGIKDGIYSKVQDQIKI